MIEKKKTTTTTIEEKLVRVIKLSGNKQDWQSWSTKFLAKARRKGYKKVLLGKESIPKDSDVLDQNTDQDEIEI